MKMGDITPITTINYSVYFIWTFTVLIGIKALISLFEWFMNKFGIETKWMRKRREEYDLLIKTAEGLSGLREMHLKDIEESNKHDTLIQNELSNFINEMRDSILKTQEEIKHFYENRIKDREQSLKIQKELTESILAVSNNEKERSQQIEALMCGSKELLGAEIDKRYRDYIALDGIPESDVDEFDDIFVAYKNLHGNHTRDMKYNYVKNHLSVIPVETKLITNKK